jgi:hypothetical protein
MKAIRALMLILALSVCASAGDMPFDRDGHIPCGKAGEMETDKTGDMPNGIAGEMDHGQARPTDMTTALALQLLQSVLPLF